MEVLTGDNGLYIQENNGPKTLSILDGDNDTYELGMVRLQLKTLVYVSHNCYLYKDT